MSRKEFDKATKKAAFARAKMHCESCSAPLSTGKYHYDHTIADGLGGEPVLSNCCVLCTTCHAFKTNTVDIPTIAKMKRQNTNHIGANSEKPKMQGPVFTPAAPQRRASRPLNKQLPPRTSVAGQPI